GVNFFSELKPGSLKGGSKGDAAAPSGAPTTTLTATQLEALRMVLAKEVAAERDSAARFVPWLATFGSVSPLLGLLGTVLGVMDAFIGIALGGSGNIAAVAPGVAEALVTTVAGLAVAVPAVMAYNLFVNRLGLFAGELEGFAQEIIGTMAREGRVGVARSLGVMDAFIGIALGGSGNIAAVAPGVAEALVTTVAGLAVAVPAVMAYNLFVNRLGLFAGELEGFAQEIIGTMAREGRL